MSGSIQPLLPHIMGFGYNPTVFNYNGPDGDFSCFTAISASCNANSINRSWFISIRIIRFFNNTIIKPVKMKTVLFRFMLSGNATYPFGSAHLSSCSSMSCSSSSSSHFWTNPSMVFTYSSRSVAMALLFSRSR